MNKLLILPLRLQLFADGGEGGADTQVVAQPYSNKAADNQAADTETIDKSKAFKDLIKGEYKDEYDRHFNEALNKRFKNVDSLKQSKQQADDILSVVAQKYNIDPTDYNGLKARLEADESWYEDQADKQGLTVEQYKKQMELEKKGRMYDMTQQEMQKQAEAKKIYDGWLSEIQELKSKGIEINLNEELKNSEFVLLLQSNFNVERAYNFVHQDELVEQSKQKVVDNIKARGLRPQENGTSSQAAGKQVLDFSKMSDKEFAEIDKKIRRGEIKL